MCRCVFSYVIVIHLHNLYVVYITSTNVVWSRTLFFLSISIYVENERHHFKIHCIILYHSLPCLIWATRYLYVQQHMDCMGWIHTKYIHHHHFVCSFFTHSRETFDDENSQMEKGHVIWLDCHSAARLLGEPINFLWLVLLCHCQLSFWWAHKQRNQQATIMVFFLSG